MTDDIQYFPLDGTPDAQLSAFERDILDQLVNIFVTKPLISLLRNGVGDSSLVDGLCRELFADGGFIPVPQHELAFLPRPGEALIPKPVDEDNHTQSVIERWGFKS